MTPVCFSPWLVVMLEGCGGGVWMGCGSGGVPPGEVHAVPTCRLAHCPDEGGDDGGGGVRANFPDTDRCRLSTT